MRALLAVLLGVLMGAGSVSAAELTSQQLAAKAQDSLVFIATKYFDENTNQTKAAGSGTGFVITAGGLVLTAYHVVKDWNGQSDEDKANNPLRVRLGSSHGDEVDAQIVGINEQYDVALLQILKPGTYKATGVCFATTLKDGEAVTAFGFPDGLERQSSPGTFGNAGAESGRWAVSLNNAEGMSGGPLYDAFGDVVGIIRSTYGGQGAVNIVTPVRRAKSMIEDQTSFTEECLRDAPTLGISSDTGLGGPTAVPVEPAPSPEAPAETPAAPAETPAVAAPASNSLWKDGDSYCDDVRQMLAATANLKLLHYADTGKAVTKVRAAPIKENLLFTVAMAHDPYCGLDTDGAGSSAIDCTLDITASQSAFKATFATAATDLGKCLKQLAWSPSKAMPDCTPTTDGVGCYFAWAKKGQEMQLYGFSSGAPAVFGLGIYATLPGK